MNGQETSTGITFGGALAVLFIGLKLAGIIAWSWWWVLAPLWIPFLIVSAFLGVLGLLWLFAELHDRRDRRAKGLPARHEHGPRARWGRRG